MCRPPERNQIALSVSTSSRSFDNFPSPSPSFLCRLSLRRHTTHLFRLNMASENITVTVIRNITTSPAPISIFVQPEDSTTPIVSGREFLWRMCSPFLRTSLLSLRGLLLPLLYSRLHLSLQVLHLDQL